MKKENLIKQRLFANSILRQLKKNRTYESLNEMFGIQIPVLARYVKGHVLPSDKRTQSIIQKYKNILIEEVKANIFINEQGHFNHLHLLYNTALLQHIAALVVSEFPFLEIDKILSISTDGLPIAYAVGFELNIEVVYAKKKKEIGVTNFIEQRVIVEHSAYNYSLYVPAESIQRDEYVLIIDDAIRSTTTTLNLIELCKTMKAIPAGVFTLISINGGAQKLSTKVNFPVKYLISL